MNDMESTRSVPRRPEPSWHSRWENDLQKFTDSYCEEEMLNIVQGPVRTLHGETAEIIKHHELEKKQRKEDAYLEWDAAIHQPLQSHLRSKLTRTSGAPAPLGPHSARLFSDNAPARQCLSERDREEAFHRFAESVIDPSKSRGSVRSKSERCRKTHPVELWGPKEHFDTPYGYFVQRCDNSMQTRSALKMGTNMHQPDESDGVPAAGKVKRSAGDSGQLRMLGGTLAKQGEAAFYKRDYGAGSIAPLQDHYFFERGSGVVNAEFPSSRTRACPS